MMNGTARSPWVDFIFLLLTRGVLRFGNGNGRYSNYRQLDSAGSRQELLHNVRLTHVVRLICVM